MTTIAFTRPIKKLKDSTEEARNLGLEAYGAPSLEVVPGEESEFKRLEESITEGAIIIFCSSTGVEACHQRYGDSFADMLNGVQIVSIGPATTKELEKHGINTDGIPSDYSSEGLVDMLKTSVSGKRVILIRSDKGSEILSEGLSKAGADVYDIATYRLKDAGMSCALLHILTMLKQGRLDAFAFSSPMSAQIFIEMLEKQFGKERGDEYLHAVKIAAIGAPTSRKLTELGFPPDIVPEKTTFTDMLVAIRDCFQS